MKWDPIQYLKFADERFRPAHDLLEQIHLTPSLIYDLGCGTGHLTKELAIRWPSSKIIGIDSSEEMLNVAKIIGPKIEWIKDDISEWVPKAEKPDLIFSNSTLHWLKNHKILFENFMKNLKSNGVLAIQMPNNFSEPTHTIAYEIINDNSFWKNKLTPFLNFTPINTINFYYELFAKYSNFINIFETTYFHILSGSNPIVEWVKGSFLRPLLQQMSPSNQNLFLEKYTNKISLSYQQQSDGNTILPFKRLFFIITKK